LGGLRPGDDPPGRASGTARSAHGFFLCNPQEDHPMSSDNDRARGTANDIGGKIKEGLGKLTGDKDLEAEGNLDQAKGKGQQALGDIKDAFKK
jgi:uncharacterized protein YjbJ (UPF0337 family)